MRVTPINFVNNITTNPDAQRFQSGAEKYAAYLETPEGRLRVDLAFANLQEFLPKRAGALRALDVGCGTGVVAMRLAQSGFQVTLLDSSVAMLDLADRAAREAGVVESTERKHGDAGELVNLFEAETFDVILCHNLLEYAADPVCVLRGAARALRSSAAILSLLVRNQAGEVVKATVKDGDLKAAEDALTAEWGNESLYGGKVRLFARDALQSMLKTASLRVVGERGVRVLSDYLPPRVSRDAEYDRIFELERKLGGRPEYAAIARYTQYFAHRADSATEDRA